MRTRLLIAGLTVLLVASTSCHDNPLAPTAPPPVAPPALQAAPAAVTLDQDISNLITQLFPPPLNNVVQNGWDNIKQLIARVSTKNHPTPEIKNALNALVSLMQAQTPRLTNLLGETKEHALVRLVLDMELYVFYGPTAPPPAIAPNADVALGTVSPTGNTQTTIQTPTQHAAVQFPAGSVAEPTTVIVTQVTGNYADNCSGPLTTHLCQYPQFYRFNVFPDVKLLKPAGVAVCHVDAGTARKPLADHDRFRLAHDKPTDPTAYSPGSTIVDSVEILPIHFFTGLISCTGNTYGRVDRPTDGPGVGPFERMLNRGLNAASRLASAIGTVISPRDLYAIDQGGGGFTLEFSNFADIDPQSLPDLAMTSPINVTPVTVFPGDTISFGSWTYTNTGTGTSPTSASALVLAGDTALSTNVVTLGSFGTSDPMPPQQSSVTVPAQKIVLPPGTPAGTYFVGAKLDPANVATEVSKTNNYWSARIQVRVLRPLVRVCPTEVSNGSTVVGTIAQALPLVSDSGTVSLCDGTHLAYNVAVARPVTITSAGPGIAAIDADTAQQALKLGGSVGFVKLHKVKLLHGANAAVDISGSYGTIVIDSSEFDPAIGATHAGVNIANASGTSLTIRSNSFVNGDIGIHVAGSNGVTLRRNSFSGQGNSAVLVTDGSLNGPLVVDSSAFGTCARVACVNAFGASTGALSFVADTFLVDVAHPVGYAIRDSLPHGTLNANDNVITATGNNGTDRTLLATYPVDTAAIRVSGTATLLRNKITNTARVFMFVDDAINATASDNVTQHVGALVRELLPQTASLTLKLNRNDFDDYTSVITGNVTAGTALDMRCNYWGGPAPHNAARTVLGAFQYTPWVTQAIAGTTGPCDPSTPFNTIRLCPTGTSSSPTVALMGDALAVVPDNGTVQVCDGTHSVSGIGIFHPVTITAEGPGMPTLDGGALLPDILFINSVSGAVTIHGLKFTGSKNAQLFVGTNTTGTVTVDHNEFHPFESFPYGSTTSTAGAGITATGTFGTLNVTNNTFLGGDVGLLLSANFVSNSTTVTGGGGTVTATANTFSTQTNIGLVWGAGGATSFVSAVPITLHAEGNSFDHCGLFACARVNSMTGGRAEFVGNHFTADIARPTQIGIQLLAGGTALVDHNDFTGTGSGTSTDRTQQSVYPFSLAGMFVQNMPATVTRNSVTNAWTGVELVTANGATTAASVTGDHNTLTHTAYPFISGSSTPSTLSWQKNDVIDYVAPTNSPSSLPNADVRCTYWGSSAGPQNPPTSGSIQYLPWSAAPIATSTTATCDPSVSVNTIRACPTPPGDAILTTATIANAYVLAPAGGTVLVCDGTFQIPSQISIQKSITIMGEGTATPTLDGGTSNQNIINLFGNNLNVTLKSLKFVNGKSHQVFLSGVTGTVLIDHAEFHPVEDGTYAAPTTGNSFAGVGAFGTFGNLTVSNSTFIGGDEGVSFSGQGGAGGTLIVSNNHFTLQTNFGVRWSGGTASAATPNMLFQLTGNTFDHCPREACVRVNSSTGGTVQISSNHFLADITRPTRVGTELFNATSGVVDHNDFTGSGFGSDRTQPAGYPFDIAAVQSQTMPITVTSNTFNYVYSPLNAGTAAITGTDNVSAHLAYAVTSFANPAAVSFSRNDFTDYLGTTNAPSQLASANLRCNYWGPAGPVNPPNTGTINYLPWATQPIANTSAACDPSVAVTTIRMCATPATDGSMTTNSLPSAYALVPANGTISICDATYPIPQTLNVQKPVTITGEGTAMPTLDGTAAGSNQSILNISGTGNVTLHQLKFQNTTGHNIVVANTTGPVSVDHVEFHPFQSFAYSAAFDPATYRDGFMAGIGAFQAIASLTVTNSQFIGGDVGVHVNPNPSTSPSNVTVRGSHFTGQSNAGFYVGGGSPSLFTHVESDTFDLCGRQGCTKFFAQGGGRAEWVNNRFVVDIAHPSNAIINVDGRNPNTTLISNNQFSGTGVTGDRSVRASYPIDGAAINGTAPTSTITGNSITGAWTAINATPGTTTATDNTISKVFSILSGGGTTPVTLALNRSDLSDYIQVTFGTNGFASMDLRCNYWGSSAGPQNPGNFVNPAPQYLPWSNTAIANQPGVSCNPNVASSTIRVCASPASDGSMTTNSLMNAYLLAPANGTISICDGSYPVPQTINIQKSVTITGEGTAVPTLDGASLPAQNAIIGIFSTNANVTLKQLKFQNSTGHNVQLSGATGAVLIDHSEFHPMQTYAYDPVLNFSTYHESYQAGVGAFGAVSSLLVTNSQFIGGDIGMHINTSGSPGASSIIARGNHFTGQSNAGFFVGGSTASLVTRAESDTFDLCGRIGCTKFYANDGGRGEWVNNRFNIDISHPVNTVVNVAGNTTTPISTLMDHNVVTGTGGAGDRTAQSTYPVDGFAFGGTGQTSTITANTVSNVWGAFSASPGTTTASNNVVSHAYTLISGGGASPVTFALNRSDLSDFIQVTFGTGGFASMDLRCNYWGQATGPSNPGNFVNPSPQYLPWSTTSIANNPSVSCNPNVATNTLRVCPTAGPTDPPTSADAQAAYNLLPAGGTMRFCDGTHTTSLFVEKPMTFTSDGPGTATLVAASGAANAIGIGAANGVTIRNLKFQGGVYSNVAVNSATGPVLIDSVQFSPPQTQTYGSGTLGYNSGVFIAAQNTAPVTVQNSNFTGGDVGVLWDQLSNVTIRRNTFTGQSNAGTHGGNGTSSNVLIDGNTYTDCGVNWCVGVFNANGVTVSNNQFTINPTRPTQNPINLYMNPTGASVVTGNTILGAGAPGSFTVQSSFPLNSGVSVSNGSATVVGNHVTNAWLGVLLTNLAATGHDNAITHVMSPLGGNSAVTNAAFTRNDFTDYATEVWNLGAFTGLSLQCNWWGFTAGPANTASLPASAFTPFATVPIAGQTGVSCP